MLTTRQTPNYPMRLPSLVQPYWCLPWQTISPLSFFNVSIVENFHLPKLLVFSSTSLDLVLENFSYYQSQVILLEFKPTHDRPKQSFSCSSGLLRIWELVPCTGVADLNTVIQKTDVFICVLGEHILSVQFCVNLQTMLFYWGLVLPDLLCFFKNYLITGWAIVLHNESLRLAQVKHSCWRIRTQSNWTTIHRIFLNSSELSILEYLKSILGRFDTSTIFKWLEFPTVHSEQHLKHRLQWFCGKIPKEARASNTIVSLICCISLQCIIIIPVKQVQKWLQFHNTWYRIFQLLWCSINM